MWQRYNQTTHIFEKSIDNGTSWTPLALNGSIITEGSVTSAPPLTIQGTSPILSLYDPNESVGNKRWRLLHYNGSNDVRFEKLVDDSSTVSATPLMIGGGGEIRVGTDIYQKGRTVPVGDWVNIPPASLIFTCNPSGTLTMGASIATAMYTLIGTTVLITIVVTGATLVGSPVRFYITGLPPAIHCGSRNSTCAIPYYSSGGGSGTGMCSAYNGLLDVLRDVVGTTWAPGSIYFYINMSYSIV